MNLSGFKFAFDGQKSDLVIWVEILMATFTISEVDAIKLLSKAYKNIPDRYKPLEKIDLNL